MEPIRSFLYNDYIKTLQEKFVRRIEDIQADYNFDHGDEFEVAVCELLRSFLPNKFGICRGHAVNAQGVSAGDDVIVYDQERFPTLKLLRKDQYERKENIPIEAVYAYIEVKHTLIISNSASNNFQKAIEQVNTVKQLCMQRPKTSWIQWDPYVTVEGGLSKNYNGFPDYRNPVLGIVLSRHVAIHNVKCTDANEINSALLQSGVKIDGYGPDLIVAGQSNILATAYQDERGIVPTVFLRPDMNFVVECFERPNIAFGIFLAQLAFACDWIKLGKMPWGDIVNDAKYGATKGLDW